jgi:hypothetical protein
MPINIVSSTYYLFEKQVKEKFLKYNKKEREAKISFLWPNSQTYLLL